MTRTGKGDAELLLPDLVFHNGDLLADKVVHVSAGRITQIESRPDADIANGQHIPGILSPGLVDLQVNGGGGVLFNSAPSPDGLRQIIAAHRSLGTARLLPTVITDRKEVLEQAVEAVISAWGMPGVAGIHIEGPHIAPAGRGAHALEYVRPLDAETITMVARLRSRYIPTLITLAPEAADAAQIAALAETGAVVSLGHSDASFAAACAALDAGATCFTHLFNAMSQMSGRDPGMVGAALHSTAYAGFICDGHHVSDTMVKIAYAAKRCPERLFLVSDAMPTVGGPRVFDLYGNTVSLQDGKLINNSGTLAGAHISMAQSVQRLVSVLNIEPAVALRMAIDTPGQLMKSDSFSSCIGESNDDCLVWTRDLSSWKKLTTWPKRTEAAYMDISKNARRTYRRVL